MEIITKKYLAALKALSTLNEALQKLNDPTLIKAHKEIRDSVIQRFEYSIDTLWKFLKEYIQFKYKVNVSIPTPKQVFKSCLDVQLVTPDEYKVLLTIIEDRNLTSHTYNEDLAKKIAAQIPLYYTTMETILARIDLKKGHS